MKVKAKLNNLRVSPEKVRLVTRQLPGMPVEDALAYCQYELKKSGDVMAKLIKSAVANAEHNHSLKAADLKVADVVVGAGPTLKRWRARAQGRASKILKRTSKITVWLTDGNDDVVEKSTAKKTTAKKATKKAAKKATKKAAKKETKKATK